MIAPREYGFTDEAALQTAIGRLGQHWKSLQSPEVPSRYTYLDTFDWRLYRAGQVLRVESAAGRRSLRLACLDADGAELLVPLEGDPPSLADDFAPGPLRERVAPLMQLRALLPVAELRGEYRQIGLVDSEDKTRVRLSIENLQLIPAHGAERPMLHTISVEPLKGYERDYRRVCDMLDAGHGLTRLERNRLERALELAGRSPCDYDSRLSFRFDPQMPVDRALREVLSALVSAMRKTEPGLIKDLDTEFLHDFRVAVRRTRSVLSQFKHVMPPDPVSNFRQEFAWLGECTGLARDLDVYLLSLDDYRRTVSPHLQAGIGQFEPFLRRRKARAHDRLVAELGSPRYRRLIAGWQRFLRSRDWPAPAIGSPPLAQVVAGRVRVLRRKLMRRGRAIDDASPAEKLHDLRKHCKKYRYLLEMFASLFPSGLADYLKALKRLQELLGDFQDCEVQTGKLLVLAQEIHREEPRNIDTLMSMGGLIEELDRRMVRLRGTYYRSFDRFASVDRKLGFEQMVDRLDPEAAGEPDL